MNDNFPKVSVLIRTYKRTEKLLRAIESVQRQTYKNVEIIVVEDGTSVSKSAIDEYFQNINILYACMGEHVGRSATGNKALELARGDYCCFLDDDDYLYESHIELLLNQILKSSSRMVYAWAEERQIREDEKVRRKFVCYRFKPSRLLLCERNYLPIQSVLFERSLYEELGGFDEALSELEDWDLWLRYSTKTTIDYIPQVTSCYYTPSNGRARRERQQRLFAAERELKKRKEKYVLLLTQNEVEDEIRCILNSFCKSILAKVKRKISSL